jgi:hypothetical protein
MKFHKPEYFNVGDTWEIEGRLSYGDGTPFNLNMGCNIQWGLIDINSNTILSFSLGNGITVIDPNGGRCLITVTPSQSGMIAVGKYTDQCRATDPTGYVSTQFQGTVYAKPSFA